MQAVADSRGQPRPVRPGHGRLASRYCAGGDAHHPPELAGEVVAVLEPDLERHVGDRVRRSPAAGRPPGSPGSGSGTRSAIARSPPGTSAGTTASTCGRSRPDRPVATASAKCVSRWRDRGRDPQQGLRVRGCGTGRRPGTACPTSCMNRAVARNPNPGDRAFSSASSWSISPTDVADLGRRQVEPAVELVPPPPLRLEGEQGVVAGQGRPGRPGPTSAAPAGTGR